jgi:hypothetical protein
VTPECPRRLNYPQFDPSRQPAVEQDQAPAAPNPPRRLGRIRQPVFNPDNVYGNRPPVDILGDNDNDDVLVHRETKVLVPVRKMLKTLSQIPQRLKCSRMGVPNS